MGPWSRIRMALESPQRQAIQSIVDDMDVIAERARRSIVSCGDCGSRRIFGHGPDGSVSVFDSFREGDDEGAAPRWLTTGEALEMISMMVTRAEGMAELEPEGEAFWEGWAGGLETLASNIRAGVKVTCFPAGSCACHPGPLEPGAAL